MYHRLNESPVWRNWFGVLFGKPSTIVSPVTARAYPGHKIKKASQPAFSSNFGNKAQRSSALVSTTSSSTTTSAIQGTNPVTVPLQ
eukprot:1316808-Rhodomonas_salina.4